MMNPGLESRSRVCRLLMSTIHDDCSMRSGMMNPGLESRSRVGRLLMSTRQMTAG